MRSAVPPFHRLRSSTGSRCEINNVSDVKIDEHIEAREKAGNNASRVKIVDEIARERICSTLRDLKHYNNGRLDHKRMHTRCSPRGMPVGLRRFLRRAGRTTFERTAKPCGPDTRCWCQVGGDKFNPTGLTSRCIRRRR
jgi:hypothetical protein